LGLGYAYYVILFVSNVHSSFVLFFSRLKFVSKYIWVWKKTEIISYFLKFCSDVLTAKIDSCKFIVGKNDVNPVS
jgi:multisubunit Na+/H+ antiporter MnhE subunit